MTAVEESVLDRTADVIAGAVNEQLAETRKRLDDALAQLSSSSRPSKADAAKLAGDTIDTWIRQRSIALHRDARLYLIEALADAFGVPEVKQADGVG